MDKPRIKRLRGLVDYIRTEIDPELQMHQLAFLLEVALAEGGEITRTDLAERLGVSPPSVSRNARVLGYMIDKKTGKKGGKQYVTMRPDLYEPRKISILLTDKGREVVERMAALMK